MLSTQEETLLLSPRSPPNSPTSANPSTEPGGYNRDENQEYSQKAGEDEDARDTDDDSVDCDGSRSDWRERQEENDDEGQITPLTPTENDIFCGRGRGIGSKPGNEKYIKLIGSKRADYLGLPKKEKQDFAEQVLKEIETQWSPPGRFLERAVDDGEEGEEGWRILSRKRIIVKICTALRKGPKSNNSRKRLQAMKRKEKLEQKLKHHKLIFPDSWKEKVEMVEEIKLNLQKPSTLREETDAGRDELDEETKTRHFDGVPPVPRSVNKRTVPSSSGKQEACEIDARRVARKTSPSASASSLSPLSLKKGNDQRAGLSGILTSSAFSDYVRVNDKYLPTRPCNDAAASLTQSPPPCPGYSAPATGITTSQALKELQYGRGALTLPESRLCNCGGILGSMPESLSLLLGGVSPPHCICSRILTSQILSVPSLSYVPCLATHMSSLSLARFATLANLPFEMPPPSALSATVPQIHEQTMVPAAMIEVMLSRTPLLEFNPYNFSVSMQNGASNQEKHQSMDAETLFIRAAKAATTFGGSSSVGRQRESDDGKDVKEGVLELEPVSSSPPIGATPTPKCQDMRTNGLSEGPSKEASEFPEGTRRLPSVPPLEAPSREPPHSPVQSKLPRQRQEQIDAAESHEVSGRATVRPMPVLSSTRMIPQKAFNMVSADASNHDDTRGLDLGEDDVFGDAEEDSLLRSASDFHLSAAFMGKFASSC